MTVEGSFATGGQYHFHMETQSCVVRPAGDGTFDVRSATQHMDGIQNVVAKALDIDNNK